jgi:type IX secretion system PorP/SprF family membrane protein
MHLQYDYKMKLGKRGILSLGTEIGFVSVGFSGDSVASHPITIGEYHNMNGDPALPTIAVSGMQFDIGFGAWYKTDKLYAGVSYRHLNNPTVTWGEKYQFTQYGVFYATGGYAFRQEDSKIEWKPSVLFKTDFAEWAFDLSLRGEYNNKFWGGISYRVLDAFVVFLGIEIMNGLSAGYSCDISTNKLGISNYGSHEIMLSYSFAFAKGGKNKYKSIRFL